MGPQIQWNEDFGETKLSINLHTLFIKSTWLNSHNIFSFKVIMAEYNRIIFILIVVSLSKRSIDRCLVDGPFDF